jgi:hypothetical protein
MENNFSWETSVPSVTRLDVIIGRVGFWSNESDQFDFLEEIGSDRVGSGSDQFICYVFSDL